MDELQIKHALDQIEIYSAQLKEYLLSASIGSAAYTELQEELEEANSELDKMTDQKDDLFEELSDLKTSTDDAKEILEELLSDGNYDEDKIQKAIDLL